MSMIIIITTTTTTLMNNLISFKSENKLIYSFSCVAVSTGTRLYNSAL